MTGRELFRKSKKILIVLVRIISFLPYRLRLWIFTKHRNFGGYYGLASRYIPLKSICKYVGDNVSIHPNVYMFNIQNLCIGSNVSIHPMSYIDSVGGLIIEDNVSIAHGTSIMTSNHEYSNTEVPIKYQGIRTASTKIEEDVWIGAKVMVLAGVTISHGCVIGAGSVVTKSTKSFGVYMGVPAKLYKSRL